MQLVTNTATQGDAGAIDDLQVLITAQEAYPAFEEAVLDAEKTITASFRIFDLMTTLRSPRGRQIGATWFDLFRHVLDRGVAIRLVVADFDAVAAVDLHRMAWRTQRQIEALREVVGPAAKLSFSIALHAATCGVVPGLTLYPLVRSKLREIATEVAQMTRAERAEFRLEAPGLRNICDWDDDDLPRFPVRFPRVTPATHHQKLAVFDGKKVYIGGLDLNERRFDTKNHAQPAHQTWHDVQLMVTGPVAAAAQAHLDTFLDSVSGKVSPAPLSEGFLRTLSRRRWNAPLHLSPHTEVSEIEQTHLHAIARSRQMIYLETQFLRHLPLARALARRAGEVPALRLIVVLPAAPEDLAFSDHQGLDGRFGEDQQLRCITCLQEAFGPERMLIASPVQPRKSDSKDRDALADSPLVYVHSKVSVFDDAAAIVSSANLNGRSMRWDTEAGLHITRQDQVVHVRERVMSSWLPADAGPEYLDCAAAFAHWADLVRKNTKLPPQDRRGFLVTYDSDAARESATSVPGVPAEIV
ncbi:phospholipase D family protein [Yoonia sp.]|uniref:phospholipase D family protein n=1 Tax=Yoonia sp. TaxID=2212373 RepID=UPI003918EBC1